MRFALALLLAAISAQAQTDLSGAWAITVVDFGRPDTMRMVLKQDGEQLTGTVGNQPLEGTVAADGISFKVGNRRTLSADRPARRRRASFASPPAA